METYMKKIENIASKYADLTEKRIDAALKKGEDLDSGAMYEINDGIRILNYVAATWLKMDQLKRNDNPMGR